MNSDAKVKKADKKMRTIAGRLLRELSRLLTVEILSCLFVHSLMLSTVSLIFLSPFLIIKVNISLFYCIISSKKTRFSTIISIFASQ